MNRRAFLAPLAVAIIWGVNVPVMKAALAEMHPFLFNAARLTLSAVALGIIDRVERGGRPATRVPWGTILWYGLLSSLAYQVLFLWGMQQTTASNTALIIASGPLWAALFSALYRLERPTGRAGLSLAIAFAGTLLVTTSGAVRGDDAPPTAPNELWGNLTILAAMMTFAWTTVLSKPLLETIPATRLAYLSVLISLPGHWLLALPFLGAVEPARPAYLGAALFYSGVLSTGVAYALWNRSVRTLGPARTATFSYLVPVVALSVAWWFLGEEPTPLQLVGGALVILGLSTRRRPAIPRALENPIMEVPNSSRNPGPNFVE
ncbi:putative inner membrane transporter yiJE [Planctomycetes bacterium Poly30]|uniref:Putative inner membrane transporter yiJE n=1 Tax=Saltatorellus ferox TaxID=2528018 RepID=A0A518EY86_9BACT|nr:putative inner membrane transporter yiJE [Planctomycetes bacterium Poly30]